MSVQYGGKVKKEAAFTNHPFDKLRKKIAAKAHVSLPPLSPADKATPPAEKDLFRAAMSGVQEISEFRELTCPAARKVFAPRYRGRPEDEALIILNEIAGGARPIHLPDTQEYVEWTNQDFRSDLARKLHEGQFSVQAFLDLHGCTISEAETETEAFLKEAIQKGLRCVKLIHGRGLRSPKGPVLKSALARLLAGRHRKQVLAFVSARQCDGGLGAMYVLLRGK